VSLPRAVQPPSTRSGNRSLAGWPALAVLLIGLAGCASLDPGGPKTEAGGPIVPTDAPKTTGLETPAGAEHKRLVAQFGGEYKAPATERYLNSVLAKLAPASDVPGEAYHVTLLNTPIVNAFALPSGDLYATRGLLALANDTSEVAAVMAHEIAHVTARHAAARAELEKKSALIGKVAEVIQSRDKGQEVEARGRLSIAGFSRQQELEADQIGVRVISRAGYDPYGASRFLASLGRSASLRASLLGQKSGDERPDLMSTHPSTPERIARAVTEARQIAAPGIGDAGRDDYLSAIDGIDFGDDPADGLVRGRRFIHPKLGFTFTAPDGFVLDNSAQAVLGVASGGAEALRLDSVRLPAGTALDTYLGSGWIDGLQSKSIETINLNGLTAATATARGGEWTFRVAVVRLGTDVYRLIFATRNLSDAVDRRFRASIDTFRRLGSDESAVVKPLHISVVKANAGDNVDTFAARMAVADRPLDTFLLLNGLERGAVLKTGERYKLVVE
jgi:predicted Zn-dependent protease